MLLLITTLLENWKTRSKLKLLLHALQNKPMQQQSAMKLTALLAKKLASKPNSMMRSSLSKAMSIIDKNVKRNIVHKNTAARKKSQLTLKVKALEPTAE